MIAAFLTLLSFAETAPADLERFPPLSVCYEQEQRCDDYLPELRRLASVRGWGADGRYHRGVAQLERDRAYWRQLSWCHHLAGCPEEGALVEALLVLKQLLGAGRYLVGWRPCLLPAPPRPALEPPADNP